mgnify:CR=1 FL=1
MIIIKDEILNKEVKEIQPKNDMDLRIKLRIFLLENGFTLLYKQTSGKTLEEIINMLEQIGYILYID